MKTDAAEPAALQPRPIFRADAVQRYIQSHQKSILPRFVCPRTFLYLWILLGLLLLAGSLAAGHLGALVTGELR